MELQPPLLLSETFLLQPRAELQILPPCLALRACFPWETLPQWWVPSQGDFLQSHPSDLSE